MSKKIIIIIIVVASTGTYFYLNNSNTEHDPVTEEIINESSQEIENTPTKPILNRFEDHQDETEETIVDVSYGEYDMPFPERSRIKDLSYDPSLPTNYTSPYYSKIVGYNLEIGATFSIPKGVEASIYDQGELNEVYAIRMEDVVTGVYSDAFSIFSCFSPDLNELEGKLSYIDSNKKRGEEILTLNNKNYRLINYDSSFALLDVGPVDKGGKTVAQCGLYLVGRDLTEVHIHFLQELGYTESREDYIKKIYDLYQEKY